MILLDQARSSRHTDTERTIAMHKPSKFLRKARTRLEPFLLTLLALSSGKKPPDVCNHTPIPTPNLAYGASLPGWPHGLLLVSERQSPKAFSEFVTVLLLPYLACIGPLSLGSVPWLGMATDG